MKRYVIDTGVLLLHLIGDERVKTYFNKEMLKRLSVK